MDVYRPRKTALSRLLTVNHWKVKVYAITKRPRFESATTLRCAVAKLPEWLETARTPGFEALDNAFLIVHEGMDGVWTLVNWWVDGGVLRGLTFHTDFDAPTEFHLFPREGFMACVWELEVILFERAMWIEHVLKKAGNPDLEAYARTSLSNENEFSD